MRFICHVDMDAFFAAVECRANPRLAGLPLVVGGGPDGRGVVTTASYPARRFGIRSGMSMREALARCPDLYFCPVDPAKYLDASRKLLRIFESFTPAVEPASIDEAFLDLTGLQLNPSEALALARRIKSEVKGREGLSCSIGIGPNKLQAKMATAVEKPDGLTLFLPGDFQKHYGTRGVQDLWGVGPETARALAETGILTIDQLARASEATLSGIFGITGRVLVHMARGEGGGPVVPYYEGLPARSMGHEMTFAGDVSDIRILEAHLLLLSDKVARRLRREGFSGHIVGVKLKWSDKSMATRQKALAVPTDQEAEILAHARILLKRHDPLVPGGRKVRLIGVSVAHLIGNTNLYPLLPVDRKARDLSRLKDDVRNRFGETALMPAGVLKLFQK